MVTHVRVVSRVAHPASTSGKAAMIAGRQPKIRRWLGQYTNVSHTSTLGDDRVWTVDYYADGDQVAEVHIPDDTGGSERGVDRPAGGWMMTRGLRRRPTAARSPAAWVLIPMCLLFWRA